MINRIRKSIDERDKGFTLIELLVVMIIIGILAAIAIPVFLSQKNKAKATAAKADVTTIGKEVAAYYVDSSGALLLTTAAGAWTLKSGATVITSGKLSSGNTATTGAGTIKTDTSFCAQVVNVDAGASNAWKYTAANGLAKGVCTAANN